MLKNGKPAKMHYKNDGNPNGNKLTSNWNKLKPKPEFFKTGFFNNTPGVVKRNQGLPWLDAGFFKHSIHANMPAHCCNKKYNPTHSFYSFSALRNGHFLHIRQKYRFGVAHQAKYEEWQ
jgi:hypothetical protein